MQFLDNHYFDFNMFKGFEILQDDLDVWERLLFDSCKCVASSVGKHRSDMVFMCSLCWQSRIFRLAFMNEHVSFQVLPMDEIVRMLKIARQQFAY